MAPPRRSTPWTADELALIERERQRWLAIGRSTEPADILATQRAWAALYRRAGREPVFVWVTPGPVAAHVAMDLWERGGLGASLYDSLSDSLVASLRDSLWASLVASLRDSLWASLDASLRASLGDSLRASLGDSLDASLEASLQASLEDSFWDSFWDSLGSSLGDSLEDSLWDSLSDSLVDSLRASLSYRSTWFWGAHDAFWVGYYDCAQQLGVVFTPEQVARLEEFKTLTQSALWSWPHEHGVVVCDRPSVCAMEETTPGRWRLHHPTGPALAFRDGYEVYAWHGLVMPKAAIQHPEAITVDQVHSEDNMERRRALIEIMGWDRYLHLSGATPVNRDAYGALYRTEFNGATVGVAVVENSTLESDGSRKRYAILGMPEHETAHALVAASFGLTPETYRPMQET